MTRPKIIMTRFMFPIGCLSVLGVVLAIHWGSPRLEGVWIRRMLRNADNNEFLIMEAVDL